MAVNIASIETVLRLYPKNVANQVTTTPVPHEHRAACGIGARWRTGVGPVSWVRQEVLLAYIVEVVKGDQPYNVGGGTNSKSMRCFVTYWVFAKTEEPANVWHRRAGRQPGAVG